MTIKLITFDLDDTLWDARPLLQAAQAKQFLWLNTQVPGFDQLNPSEKLSSIRKVLVQDNPNLSNDLSMLRTEILYQALLNMDIMSSKARELAREAFQVFILARHDIVYFEGALELLQTLSTRFIIGALTNGNADVRCLEIAKYFSFSYCATDFSAAKPAPAMFMAALKFANADASETVHIGDHPIHDVQAATSLGIGSIWLNAGSKTPPASELNFKEVTHLSEIPSCLKLF